MTLSSLLSVHKRGVCVGGGGGGRQGELELDGCEKHEGLGEILCCSPHSPSPVFPATLAK